MAAGSYVIFNGHFNIISQFIKIQKEIRLVKQLLGAHTSIAGGVSKAIDLAVKLGFNAMQIFTKNNNRWANKPLSTEEIESFRIKLKNSGIKFVVAHDSYLINLCAADPELLQKSREAFLDELLRCSLLGIPYLNFHPGAHSGRGEEDGIKLLAESLNIIHSVTKEHNIDNVSSMIETTAGQGSALGYRFEQIRKIIDLVEDKDRISVCIDTAHIWAAGYDIKNPDTYNNVIKDFDNIIGINRLKCFHMNDSKKNLGSRVDRHDHIGRGMIGLEGFRNLMNDYGVPQKLDNNLRWKNLKL
jgi:deoxyribonuclease IV